MASERETSRRGRSRALVVATAATTLVALGACADLIGANFDPYEVEPSGSGGSGSTTIAATSSSAGTTTAVTTGDGGGGNGGAGAGGATTTTAEASSTSTGVSCEEWPAGSGEWRWAAQLPIERPGHLGVVSLVPSNSSVFPWVAFGSYQGTLFGSTATVEAPFAVSLGPSGVDELGALAVPCAAPCGSISLADGATDRSTWSEFGTATWVVGRFGGTFNGNEAASQQTPFVMRVTQDDTPNHVLQTGTFIFGTDAELGPDTGDYLGVDASEGLVSVTGDVPFNRLYQLDEPLNDNAQFFVGIASGVHPFFLSKRAGRLTGGADGNACDDDGTEQAHLRDVDIALAPPNVWSAGKYCGTGPLGGETSNATEPGDGFIIVQNVGGAGEELRVDGSGEASLTFGAPVTAIAAIDGESAVIAGEIAANDRAPRLPDDTVPFLDGRDVYVAWMDLTGNALDARWAVSLGAPGEQHLYDVVVRRKSADDYDIYVAGSTDAPLAAGGFTSPCDFAGERIAFVAKLDASGALQWIRTFGLDGAAALRLSVGEEGLIVAADTGIGGYTLEPHEGGAPIELEQAFDSILVGELSF